MTLDELIAEADKYILPVDVRVGAGTFRAGCKVGTVLRSIKVHAEARIAHAAPEAPICAGCGFAHSAVYPHCVWNKDIG